jgi:hypothetical protein
MTKMTIPRMFTDEAGESRFDSYEVPLTLHDHAPPAAPFLLSEPSTATKYLFFRIPPGWLGSATSDTKLPASDLLVRRSEVHWEHW